MPGAAGGTKSPAGGGDGAGALPCVPRIAPARTAPAAVHDTLGKTRDGKRRLGGATDAEPTRCGAEAGWGLPAPAARRCPAVPRALKPAEQPGAVAARRGGLRIGKAHGEGHPDGDGQCEVPAKATPCSLLH